MSKATLVSVVIATFNRCDVLGITLEKLAGQTLGPENFEVIVVDDGSTDKTEEAAESWIRSMPYELRYLRHSNRGPGYTQNRGIREARSNIIVLIADDIQPCGEFLEQHVKTHTANPGDNIAVLGKAVQSPELPQSIIHKYWDPFMYYRFDGKRELDGVFFFACNISVKKNFLLQNGMYKERKGAAHEDVELGYRLGRKGLRIFYNERAIAFHYHIETLSKACRRAYERGRNFDMLSENIPKPFIFSLYHICSPEAGFKAVAKMLPREIPRRILFNRLTVGFFWRPLLERAESSALAAVFANGITYRGTIHYHQRVGYSDMKRERRQMLKKERASSEK